jgi:hypothetical protein
MFWALKGYTHYLVEGESVMHKSIGFFNPYGYMSDDKIASFVFIYVSNKFAPLTPPTAALFRHWAPLGATSQKMDSHRWSLFVSATRSLPESPNSSRFSAGGGLDTGICCTDSMTFGDMVRAG